MLLGVIIPLLVGMMIYYLFFPEVIFVKTIDRLLGISFHVPLKTQIIYLKVVRWYFLDILWAVAFTALVLALFGINKTTVSCIVSFELIMETIQIAPSVKGTFDVCDIFFELIASVLVIYLYKRRMRNEKD